MARSIRAKTQLRPVTALELAETSSALVDLLAARRDHIPLCAERPRALALRLAGPVVVVVVVERVTAVGRLQLAVPAPRRADLRRDNAGAGGRLARRDERRPDLRARAVAGTLAA